MLLFFAYEFVVRFVPTNRSLSSIDFIKAILDKLIPNYQREDFPLKKHP